jgi:antitoxin component of MazEF toxin-antitoxin module
MYVRRLTLRQSGGNACISIPRDLCRHLNLIIGTQYDVAYENGKFTVDFTSAEQSSLFGDMPVEAEALDSPVRFGADPTKVVRPAQESAEAA